MSIYGYAYRHARQDIREMELHSEDVQAQLDGLSEKERIRKEAQREMSYRRARKRPLTQLERTLRGLKG